MQKWAPWSMTPFEERLGLDALADQAPLHVGDGDDQRVDLAVPHLALELLHARVLAGRVVGPLVVSVSRASRPSLPRGYFAVIAPSATITEPVTNDDSSDARNSATLAISRGSPGRPMGWNESMVA